MMNRIWTRRALLALATAAFALGSSADAARSMCGSCAGKIFNTAIGSCSSCDEYTPSMGWKYCAKCAKEKNACQACGQALSTASPGESSLRGEAADVDTVRASNRFALDLYRQMASTSVQSRGERVERVDNLFLAPYSVSSAMAMVAVGARGQTESQLNTVLGLPGGTDATRAQSAAALGALNADLTGSKDTDGYRFTVANALWVNQQFQLANDYVDLNQKYFGAGLERLNIAGAPERSRKTINRWVERHTNDKIQDLMPPGSLDDPMIRLVLTNAVYFKGEWAEAFDARRTREHDFIEAMTRMVNDKAAPTHKTPFMNLKSDFAYHKDGDLQILEMPYKGGRMAMTILLPGERVTSNEALREVEEKLTPTQLEKWLGALRKQEVKVIFPKFKMDWGATDLTDALDALGMPLVFSDGADLSGITGKPDLKITAVYHKTFIEVIEEGTEAAGATGAVAATRSLPRYPTFHANHPFIYLIRDKQTGAILFVGRFARP